MSDWIKCSERVPEEHLRVLTYDIHGHYEVDYKLNLNHPDLPYLWWNRKEGERHFITHWMPLPKPPEEK